MTTDDPASDKMKAYPPHQESELPADSYTLNSDARSLSEQKQTLFQQVPLESDAPNLDAHTGDHINMNGQRPEPLGSDDERPSSSGSVPIEHEEVPADWNEISNVDARQGDDGSRTVFYNRRDSHVHSQDTREHDPNIVQNAVYLRTSSGSCNSSATTSDLRQLFSEATAAVCDECNLLRKECHSAISIQFWDGIESGCSGDPSKRCHMKYWVNFLEHHSKKYKSGVLKNNNIKELMKRLLQVESNEPVAEVSLSSLVYAMNFFGPIIDSEGNSPFVTHITEIAEKLVMKKDNTKVSPFAGKMSREEAERRLENTKDKTYLIRMSQTESNTGTFVISVKQDIVHHFSIMGNPEAAASSSPFSAHLEFDDKIFKYLPEVVEHLKSNAIKDEDDNGDIVRIWCRYPCPGLPLNSAIVKYKKTR